MTQYRTYKYTGHLVPLHGDAVAALILLLRSQGITQGQARKGWDIINDLAHGRGGRTLAHYTRAVDSGNAKAEAHQ